MSLIVGGLDLSQLPAPALIKVDFESDFDERKARLVELLVLAGYDVTVQDLETDPFIILQRADNIREMLSKLAINDVYKQTLVAFAVDAALDHFAAQFAGIVRQAGEKDDRFRERVILEIQNRSGGRLAGYQADCMRFSSSIAKVGAWVDRSNLLEPTVNLALMTAISGNWVESNAISPSTLRWDWAGTTGIASADLVAATQQYIERDDIKQATDVVRVSSCSVIEGIIDVTLHHLQGPDPVLLRRSAAEAISKLIAARKQPHRDMPSSAVSAAAFVGGVERVSVTHPAGGITAQFGQMVHIASIIVRSAATDV